jgi:hypothetical protein
MVAGPYALAVASFWALLSIPALVLVTVSALPATIADEIRLPLAWRGSQPSAPDASAVGRPS